MGKYDHLFKKMQDSKPGNGEYAERLGLGEHAVKILSYIAKDPDGDSDSGVIIETEFEIVESSDPAIKPGETRGWAWWPEAGKWKKYAEARVMQFVKACADSLGDTTPTGELGGVFIEDDQPLRGLVLVAQVTKGKPHKEIAGEFYHNIKWIAVPQTNEQLDESRAELDVRVPKVAAAVATAPTRQANAAAPAATSFTRRTAAPAAAAAPEPTQPAPAAKTGSVLSGFRRG